jgi:hypothetical protein
VLRPSASGCFGRDQNSDVMGVALPPGTSEQGHVDAVLVLRHDSGQMIASSSRHDSIYHESGSQAESPPIDNR